MIDEGRIKEAKSNLSKYLKEGLLRKKSDDIAFKIFIKNSQDSLRSAQILFENNINIWTIVCSYYSMFYIANALLLKFGYKVGDKIVHKVTADALISIIQPKLKNKLLEDYEEIQEEALKIAEIKSHELIQNFDFERNKRGFIQYKTSNKDISNKAKTSLNRAKEFIFEMEKLIFT